MISDLAGISALSVLSRNSAMALKGTTLDTRTLASRHGVTHLVTGSVRKAGSSFRITVALDPAHHVAILVRGLVAATGGRIATAPSIVPGALRLHTLGAHFMAEADRHDEAITILERAAASASNDPHRSLALFLASALHGDERHALELLAMEDVRRLRSEWDFLALAGGCAVLDRTTEGVAWARGATHAGHSQRPAAFVCWTGAGSGGPLRTAAGGRATRRS